MTHQEHVSEHTPWTRYLWTWVALLVLTTLTFGLSYLPLGPWEMPVAMLIAAAKGALVILFFMHLVEMKRVIALVPLAVIGFMTLLLGLMGADVISRHTFPPAPLPLEAPKPLDLRPPPAGGSFAR